MLEDKRVIVLIVNHNGGQYIERALQSMISQSHKNLAIYVYDNASTDGSVEMIKKYPAVRLVRGRTNLGFAAANNRLLRLVHSKERPDYVALANNDMYVDRDWVKRMLETATAFPAIGIVAPRIYFYKKFIPLKIEIPVFVPRKEEKSTDNRRLGIKVDVRSVIPRGQQYQKCFWSGSFYSEEHDPITFRWTSEQGLVYVPVDDEDAEFHILVNSRIARPRLLRIRVGDWLALETEVSGKEWVSLPFIVPRQVIAKASTNIINNAGSEIMMESGYGKDIGFGTPDGEFFDQSRNVAAFCGAAALLKSSMMKDVGGFAENFQSYYEDTDLSWRATRKGWLAVYCPSAICFHAHATGFTEYSDRFILLTERNRLLMLWRNGQIHHAFLELVGYCVFVLLCLYRSYVRHEPQNVHHPRTRLMAVLSFLRRFPNNFKSYPVA